MRFEHFTVSAQEALQSGRRLAEEHSHQYMEVCHVLLPMLEQRGGVVSSLLRKCEIDLDWLRGEANQTLSALPSVSRSDEDDVFISKALGRQLGQAEKLAKKLGELQTRCDTLANRIEEDELAKGERGRNAVLSAEQQRLEYEKAKSKSPSMEA